MASHARGARRLLGARSSRMELWPTTRPSTQLADPHREVENSSHTCWPETHQRSPLELRDRGLGIGDGLAEAWVADGVACWRSGSRAGPDRDAFVPCAHDARQRVRIITAQSPTPAKAAREATPAARRTRFRRRASQHVVRKHPKPQPREAAALVDCHTGLTHDGNARPPRPPRACKQVPLPTYEAEDWALQVHQEIVEVSSLRDIPKDLEAVASVTIRTVAQQRNGRRGRARCARSGLRRIVHGRAHGDVVGANGR